MYNLYEKLKVSSTRAKEHYLSRRITSARARAIAVVRMNDSIKFALNGELLATVIINSSSKV